MNLFPYLAWHNFILEFFMLCHYRLCLCIALLLIAIDNTAQQIVTDTSTHKTVIAGPAYKKSHFYQWLWGRNRRTEWATPVAVSVLWLDSVYGGLKPYKRSGGNESKSLKLHTSDGKEYALHSVNKSRDSVVLPIFKHTFVDDIIRDGVSMMYPYGGLALPVMQQKAGIYHTMPAAVYVPRQAALDTFNDRYGNDLYLFEQKPAGDWTSADNLGNFKDFTETWDLIPKLLKDANSFADQHAFVYARLFDMLIGDWDRHEENWSWGEKDSLGKKWYEPVPRDRDQTFFTHNGVLINVALSAAGLGFMKNFGYRVDDVGKYNLEAKDMDRFFTNTLTLADWVHAAKILQNTLTDTVIVQSVQQLPPEIFAVSGKEVIEKLKARREQLVHFATRYYLFVAEDVEVIGTKKRDYFEVYKTSSGETAVAVFALSDSAQIEGAPYYQRIFKPSETKEIRLFGIEGEDVYDIRDHAKGITIRVIGGSEKDTIKQTGHKIHVYDNAGNIFQTSSARKHLANDSAVHAWNYEWFNYDVFGFQPVVFYNNADRFFVGLHYALKKYKWRKSPFATKQKIGVNYSLSQHAFSVGWSALYPKLVGGWDLSLQANYDAVRWTNFYGTGNETIQTTTSFSYYRLRSEEWYGEAGLHHALGKSTVGVSAYYQQVRNKVDLNYYPSKVFYSTPDVFKTNRYAGVMLTYTYVSLNDSVVPVKGFTFFGQATYANNFTQQQFYQRYDASMRGYLPFNKYFSLSVRVGGATIVNDEVLNSGQPYEHAIIGGPRYLRGYRRERFWGKTSFYNSNELRFITNLHTHLMNGKIGLLGFFDNGRVWMPGESSNKLHMSYGPGLILAPFNKCNLTLSYGISEEMRLFQLKLNTLFN